MLSGDTCRLLDS